MATSVGSSYAELKLNRMGMPAHPSSMLTNHDPDAPPHVTERCTKSGRRLFYCLKVIQQPERARACGSGPKCESFLALPRSSPRGD